MKRNDPKDRGAELAMLAVLAAAAKEAEELIAEDPGLLPEAAAEADRRLNLFMRTARELAR